VEKARTWTSGEEKDKRPGLKRKGEIMNRLRIFLIGAALLTGGSAWAQAQVFQQDVAYREHDRDRDRDGRYRGGDRDDRRSYYDRDDRRGYYGRDDRRGYDRDDRRYVRDGRRWDGRRWWYWNGYRWE
jgi:hypothetical protein